MAEPEHAFNLIPQQILNQVSMVEDGTLYSSDNYSKPPGNADQLTCYSNQNLDENSLMEYSLCEECPGTESGTQQVLAD
ncbi:hypothetical protein D910_05617 [Dendroctonus ponderosae]